MQLKKILVTAVALAAAAFAQTDAAGGQSAAESPEQHPEKGVFSRNWRGMLVDLQCGSSTADRVEDPKAPPPFGPRVPHLTLTDWQACPATADTSEFGLVFYSGRAVRLGEEANAMAAEELKKPPSWWRRQSWLSGEGPPLAQIRGTLYGDTLQLESMKPVKSLR
jgi:hypothetical protein